MKIATFVQAVQALLEGIKKSAMAYARPTECPVLTALMLLLLLPGKGRTGRVTGLHVLNARYCFPVPVLFLYCLFRAVLFPVPTDGPRDARLEAYMRAEVRAQYAHGISAWY
eukprot:2962697-Rhodomonas_salina.5